MDAVPCPGAVSTPEHPSSSSTLHVLAAGSLRMPFEELAGDWRERTTVPLCISYDNARELARRIEAGERADVFASASPEHPAALHARGLVDEPHPFATNRLVVSVPFRSDAHDAGILAEPGCRVAIETEGIPLGDYTRTLLERLEQLRGQGFAAAVMANVVSQERTVAAVIARLDSGEADAAVLYNTDVIATDGRLRAIEVPPDAWVHGTYVIATVCAAAQPHAADAWLTLIHGQIGRVILGAAGFGVPR
ncbi:MAG: molybdate ABC transporter substrate-binding protein [Solirubrobacterales bacterium]|nr:MAG: molybdate ABC transporter substrate-binding protein [Solirubrobacterales bacterium]